MPLESSPRCVVPPLGWGGSHPVGKLPTGRRSRRRSRCRRILSGGARALFVACVGRARGPCTVFRDRDRDRDRARDRARARDRDRGSSTVFRDRRRGPVAVPLVRGRLLSYALAALLVTHVLGCDEIYVAGQLFCYVTDDCPHDYVCHEGHCVDPAAVPPAPVADAVGADSSGPPSRPPPDRVDAVAPARNCDPAVCAATPPPSPCWRMHCDEEADECLATALREGEVCVPSDACAAADPGCRPPPCVVYLCTQGLCAPSAVRCGTPCEDEDPCTTGSLCQGGVCVPGTQPACDDGNPCTQNLCDASSGVCSHPPRSDGLPCRPADRCQTGGECVSGVCVGDPVVCEDGNPCTSGSCDPVRGECAYVPLADGVACDDGDPCTDEGRCEEGVCHAPRRADCGD